MIRSNFEKTNRNPPVHHSLEVGNAITVTVVTQVAEGPARVSFLHFCVVFVTVSTKVFR